MNCRIRFENAAGYAQIFHLQLIYIGSVYIAEMVRDARLTSLSTTHPVQRSERHKDPQNIKGTSHFALVYQIFKLLQLFSLSFILLLDFLSRCFIKIFPFLLLLHYPKQLLWKDRRERHDSLSRTKPINKKKQTFSLIFRFAFRYFACLKAGFDTQGLLFRISPQGIHENIARIE